MEWARSGSWDQEVGTIRVDPGRHAADPRGGRRLLPFDCEVRYKKTTMKKGGKMSKKCGYGC
jgi:hypothetical protein